MFLPPMAFSQFGDKFTQHSGISRLMEDMGEGLRTPGTIMLGGGNPAQIPAINDYSVSCCCRCIRTAS